MLSGYVCDTRLCLCVYECGGTRLWLHVNICVCLCPCIVSVNGAWCEDVCLCEHICLCLCVSELLIWGVRDFEAVSLFSTLLSVLAPEGGERPDPV